ncbi:hypothetical protein [Brevibacillus sp. NRS-1366]|uniref:hypothetical protein n=1 Tax=Brevibacillus sp. NRS-1366 TaxID=3233899 RepID=UPI003D1AC63A
MNKFKIERPLFLFCIGVATIFSIMVLYGYFVFEAFDTLDKSGPFGDTFGALNTAFTGCTIIGLVITIAMQRQANEEGKETQAEQSKLVKLQMANENFNFYLDELDRSIQRDLAKISIVVESAKSLCEYKASAGELLVKLHPDEVWSLFEDDLGSLRAQVALFGNILEYIEVEYTGVEDNDRLLRMRRLVLINRIPEVYITFIALYSLLSDRFFHLFHPYVEHALGFEDEAKDELKAALIREIEEKEARRKNIS